MYILEYRRVLRIRIDFVLLLGSSYEIIVNTSQDAFFENVCVAIDYSLLFAV